MKTLEPDTDAMNDVSPVNDPDEEGSIEEKKVVPVSIDDVPELPENMDEELVQPITRDDSDEFLKKPPRQKEEER